MMLANAADAGSETEMRTAYQSMLAEMTAFDVANLAKIEAAKPLLFREDGAIRTTGLPERITIESISKKGVDYHLGDFDSELRSDVAISLCNLGRTRLPSAHSRWQAYLQVCPNH